MSSNLDRTAKKVQKLKDNIEEETERGLAIGMGRLLGHMKHRLAVNRSVATGTLYKGLEADRAADPVPETYATWEITGPDYWRFLEFGTGMGSKYKAPSPQSPIIPIYEWVVAKGIVPDPTGPYDTQWQLAGAIAADTSSGTKQHKFARPAWRGANGHRAIVEEVHDGAKRGARKT